MDSLNAYRYIRERYQGLAAPLLPAHVIKLTRQVSLLYWITVGVDNSIR